MVFHYCGVEQITVSELTLNCDEHIVQLLRDMKEESSIFFLRQLPLRGHGNVNVPLQKKQKASEEVGQDVCNVCAFSSRWKVYWKSRDHRALHSPPQHHVFSMFG